MKDIIKRYAVYNNIKLNLSVAVQRENAKGVKSATYGCFYGYDICEVFLEQRKEIVVLGHRERALMRSLISPLQGVINALLNGQLVPRPDRATRPVPRKGIIPLTLAFYFPHFGAVRNMPVLMIFFSRFALWRIASSIKSEKKFRASVILSQNR